VNSINENLAYINEGIATAAKKSGRNMSDIRLVGVTKSIDIKGIRQLISAGVTHLGENRVQDFLPKYEALTSAPAPTWHFIGNLQRNKVKFIIDKVAMIHSVDSLALAQEIDKRAGQTGRIMDILIEVNIASEDSKHGITPEEAVPLANKLSELRNIQLKGLMCIAPFVENPEENRKHFRKMHNLFLDINSWHPHNITELSMGMSGDYTVAIEEGSTMVRIGTALVGDKTI